MRRRSSGTLISGAARLWPWPRTWASPRPQRPGRSQNTSAAGHERRRSTMSLIHLSTELRQELKLTPQLLQSMEVLQMNSQELLDYLNQVSEENPLVEQTDLASLHKAYEALRQKVHWINRSEEHTSELQSRFDLVCRLLLEKQKQKYKVVPTH